jgi:hypothetical protein
MTPPCPFSRGLVPGIMLIKSEGKHTGQAVLQSVGIPRILPKMAWTTNKPAGRTTVRRALKTIIPIRRFGGIRERTFGIINWGKRTKYQGQIKTMMKRKIEDNVNGTWDIKAAIDNEMAAIMRVPKRRVLVRFFRSPRKRTKAV